MEIRLEITLEIERDEKTSENSRNFNSCFGDTNLCYALLENSFVWKRFARDFPMKSGAFRLTTTGHAHVQVCEIACKFKGREDVAGRRTKIRSIVFARPTDREDRGETGFLQVFSSILSRTFDSGDTLFYDSSTGIRTDFKRFRLVPSRYNA